jgi:hypothetical protein
MFRKGPKCIWTYICMKCLLLVHAAIHRELVMLRFFFCLCGYRVTRLICPIQGASEWMGGCLVGRSATWKVASILIVLLMWTQESNVSCQRCGGSYSSGMYDRVRMSCTAGSGLPCLAVGSIYPFEQVSVVLAWGMANE